MFLAPLMSLDILLFSFEVLSLCYRNVGAQEVIVQYLFVYTSLSVFNLSGLSILCVTEQFTKCKFLLIAVLICWVFFKLNKYSTQQERLFSMWPCCCNLRRDRIFFSWWRKQHLFLVSCSFPPSDNAFRCTILIPSEEMENLKFDPSFKAVVTLWQQWVELNSAMSSKNYKSR